MSVQRTESSTPTVRLKPSGTDSRGRLGAIIAASMVFPPILISELWANRSEKYKQWLIAAVFVIFGATLVPGSADVARQIWAIEYVFGTMSFTNFVDDLFRVLTFRMTEANTRDPYLHITGYFFGGVLGLPQLWLPAMAGVYGYFFGGSVLHVLRHFKLAKSNYVLIALAVTFLLILALTGLQNTRTGIGAWILVYSCLKYYESRRLRYLFLMLTPPFFHSGFWLMALPAWFVLAFGSRPVLYSTLLIVSSFTNVLPVDTVSQQLSRTERGEFWVHWYSREEQTDAVERFMDRRETTNWYNAYRQAGFHRWAPIVLAIVLIATGVYKTGMNRFQRRILSVGILTMAFSNMTWFLSAVHNRSLIIANLFILAAFLMARYHPETSAAFRNLPPYYRWGLYLTVLLYFPQILFNLSVTLDRLSVFMFALPFLVLLDPEINIPMKDFINQMLGRR